MKEWYQYASDGFLPISWRLMAFKIKKAIFKGEAWRHYKFCAADWRNILGSCP